MSRAKFVHDVYIEVPTTLAPESAAAARVVVRRTSGINRTESVADAVVELILSEGKKKTPLCKGRTDATGTVALRFDVPALADGDYRLTVATSSDAGKHEAGFDVKLRRDFKILLVCDKPLYQPGQMIHLRALALDANRMKALGKQAILFEIEDGKGNKVFKRAGETDEFGVASVDFLLADEVILGTYKITAVVGAGRAEKSVTVKRYVLPKFKLAVTTDKAFYQPREKVKGKVQADYFFGKPVAGRVVIKASTFDAELREFQQVSVETDRNGTAEFEIELPSYFVGQPLDHGNGYLQLDVTVTDSADHAETTAKTASVCNQPLLVAAVPESGKLVPGVENIVYVIASTPDGAPAEADIAMTAADAEIKGTTNASGFVALRFTPKQAGDLSVTLRARQKNGVSAERTVTLSSEAGKDQVLLRPAVSMASVGDKLALDVLATFENTIAYVDVVRRGQTILTTTCDVVKGHGRIELPLTPDLAGSLEIHAYVITGGAQIVRDSRIVFVQPAGGLTIDVQADKPEYRPGQDAFLTFRVTDADGRGVRSALGVIVVDESVYALQEMQPGLEKIFFMLEKELLEPKIDIKWSGSLPDAITTGTRSEIASILMAPLALPDRRATTNTMSERMAQVAPQLQQIYGHLQNYIYANPGKFYVEKNGRRELDPAILDKLSLPKKLRHDPWGNPLEIADIAALNAAFTFEHWAKQLSTANVQAIFAALSGWMATQDPTAPDVLEAMVKAGRLTAQQIDDPFGDRFTPAKLASIEAAFTHDNLLRMANAVRKQMIFQQLQALATSSSIFDGEDFVRDIEARVGAELFAKADGGRFDLAALGRENAAFQPANLKRIGAVARRASAHAALVQVAQKEGFGKLAEIRNGRWTFTKAAEEAAGADLEAMSKDDPQFAPQAFVANLMRQAAAAIDNAICSKYHSGNNKMPDEPVAALVKAGALTREAVTDPWGTPLKLVKVTPELPSTLGCGMLSGQWTVVSAGPDRQFGTADDINVGGTPGGGSYQPNYQGCVFYSHTDAGIRWAVTVEQEQDFGDADDGVLDAMPQRRIMRAGFGAGMGRGAPAEMAAAAPAGMMMKAGAVPKKMPMLTEKTKAAPVAAEPEAPTRVREYFPETLSWMPSLITDRDGKAMLAVPMADSITTWRLTASANTIDGRLGSTTSSMRVFQDFFIDIDLPVALTQNDIVSVPVAVYNYLKTEQTVVLTIEKDDWFELLDVDRKAVGIRPGEVKAVYYRIKAVRLGAANRLTVHAKGTSLSDAQRRTVDVVPDGKPVDETFNGQLSGKIHHTFVVPPRSIEHASRLLFKAYPGVFASVMDGLEGLLRMPGG